MTSIFLEPCDTADYSASAELLSISPSDMQAIADHVGFDDPQFLSRLDKFEEHLNSDLTFEQYVSLMDELPCPCPTCITESGMTTVEYAIAFLQKLQSSWATLLNVVEPYSTPPNSPVGESFPYEAPQTSPTNQEMHAMNGNHIHTKIPFIRDVADVLNGVHEAYEEVPNIIEKFRSKGKYSSDDAMRHYKKYFSNHPSGKYYDAGTPEYDEWWSLYQQSLKPTQLKKLKKITNKEQHAKNGNPTKWSWKPEHKELDSETVWDREAKGENPAEIVPMPGPTNKEMHAYNGNPPKMGPRTKAQHQRTERKKIRNAKKRAETKAYLKIIKKGAAPFPLNRPKRKKRMTKVEKTEKVIANKYMRFMKSPIYSAPRLGSSGNLPTKIVHGFNRVTYNMASITSGFTSVSNATYIVACLNPFMFSRYKDTTNFKAPVIVGFSQDSTTNPLANTSVASYDLKSFINEASLKNEVLASTTLDTGTAKARFLGGAITMECRCPMTTTAPPFLFGGILPNTGVMSDGTQSSASALPAMTNGTTLRNLPSTTDVPGFQVSSVYQPSSTTDLEFNDQTADYCTTPYRRPSPVPYVGMVNCPTSAVVTVTFTGWFEVQQLFNASVGSTGFYSGWAKGPRVSTEDIFDFLRPFNSVSTRAIGMGARADVSLSGSMLMSALEPPRPRQKTLEEELSELKQTIQHLKLQIDSEEDEKYFDVEATPSLDKQDTPIYKGLSKSTIDLAMSLKKSLTPGSVTNKTVQQSSQ